MASVDATLVAEKLPGEQTAKALSVGDRAQRSVAEQRPPVVSDCATLVAEKMSGEQTVTDVRVRRRHDGSANKSHHQRRRSLEKLTAVAAAAPQTGVRIRRRHNDSASIGTHR